MIRRPPRSTRPATLFPYTTLFRSFTDIDGNGLAGIEKSFDEQLRDPARTGDPLQLSLDIRVQHIVRDELARAVETFQAIGAGAIVMDIYTGEVISMVSLPDFDPADPGSASADARFNRITLGGEEMGSTMRSEEHTSGLQSLMRSP